MLECEDYQPKIASGQSDGLLASARDGLCNGERVQATSIGLKCLLVLFSEEREERRARRWYVVRCNES